MTYKEARVYLDKVSKYGSVLGLDTIRNLLNELGNPQDKLKFIHIAGTNGKGSTLSFISTILCEAGYRTGRYISPSVQSYLEMIQVNEKWISEEDFTELVEKVEKAIVRMEMKGQKSPTIFEIETAIAFLYFYNKACDYVVLETGLGGIEDATNVINNTVAAVFATISRDHMGILGNSLEEIAEKKAGIIKSGSVVVSAKQQTEVEKVLRSRAEELKCSIAFSEPEKAVVSEEDYQKIIFSYKEMDNLQICMTGKYQLMNVSTALELVRTGIIPGISTETVRRALQKAVWPGRFTCISENPVFIIDGAHNEDAANKLRESVEQYFPENKKIFICGVFKDKEYEKMSQIMAPLADMIYTIELPNKDRTLDAVTLREVMQKYCGSECKVEAAGSILAAIKNALSEAGAEDVILAFGSLSYLGTVMQYIREIYEGK